MGDYRLRALPIVGKRDVEGAVTAQSLCRVLLLTRGLRNVRISGIMKRKLITVNKVKSLSKARSLMLKNGVDHLPVIDSGTLCGLLMSSHLVFLNVPERRTGERSIRRSTIEILGP
jgi:CBS-domain-containing membrane protein